MDNPERVTYFAATDSRGKRVPFGIKAKDRDRHMYVIGKTGMGKSTLLENLAIQDLQCGEGLAFIDPHGGTVERLLDYVPESRINDVVYFAPFDMDNPIAFNVMEDVGYDKRHLVVSGLMATFKKIWQDAWSARMEYILTNTLLALLEYPDATLLGVNRMYTDKEYRKRVIDNVKDPVVKDFWLKEFANYGDRYTQEATPAIQNKIGQFTGNPLIRNIIGQPKSSFDIREMMDDRKILLINLSKGLVGETNMRLLGSMLTTRIFLSAMSRADTQPEQLRRLPAFYFYVDEFQNFANETFAEILSEARKYRLNLVIAHQYIEQMEEEVRDAVFGNVGTTVSFRVGPFDAETLETVFMPVFTKEDIVNLDRNQIYLSLMIDGVGSAPFSAVTLPPIEPPQASYRNEIIGASRKRFAAQRSKIEQAIMDELNASLDAEAPQDARMRRVPAKRPNASTPYVAHTTPSHTAHSTSEPVRPNDHLAQRHSEPVRQGPSQRPQRPFVREQAAPSPREAQPQPAQKSPGELRNILRSMAEKANQERSSIAGKQQQNLSSTLAHVTERRVPPDGPGAVEPHVPQAPEPRAVEQSTPPPLPKPAAPQQDTARAMHDTAPLRQPFEIPEEQLRKILKGEL